MDYAPVTLSGRELVLQISGATTGPSAMRFFETTFSTRATGIRS